jgi:flagellar basal-body rod protein FlgB
MSALIDNSVSALVSLALDATTLRQQTIAHNIANVNTPGYQAIGVSFESRLDQVRQSLQQGRLVGAADLGSQLRPTVETQDGSGAVALEMEIAKLSENSLQHQTLLKVLSRHYAILSSAINDGKA